jgi:hypothetical protein
VTEHFGKSLNNNGKWTSPSPGQWRFSGRDGKAWTGTLKIEPDPGKKGEYTAELILTRAS